MERDGLPKDVLSAMYDAVSTHEIYEAAEAGPYEVAELLKKVAAVAVEADRKARGNKR